MKNIGKMMKQAQQMQSQMAEIQKELEETIFEATAGGVVTVKVTGAMDPVEIKISPEALEDADAEMLEDMILAALRSAQDAAKRASQGKMGPLMGGMPGF
ncbi:YbaB/EbfC family nucleoid-associated protein [bacterium]|nr:YbaB/EbfC family nucleoid-associated protein [bacterium]